MNSIAFEIPARGKYVEVSQSRSTERFPDKEVWSVILYMWNNLALIQERAICLEYCYPVIPHCYQPFLFPIFGARSIRTTNSVHSWPVTNISLDKIFPIIFPIIQIKLATIFSSSIKVIFFIFELTSNTFDRTCRDASEDKNRFRIKCFCFKRNKLANVCFSRLSR